MELSQHLAQTQKLNLTQAMKQALECLTLPIQDLNTYLQTAALSNPILEIDEAAFENFMLSIDDIRVDLRDRNLWSEGEGGAQDKFNGIVSLPQTFEEYLNEQLFQMKDLTEYNCSLCCFLVGCLNDAGYLDCDLSDLAQEIKVSLFDLEQALYVVQMLDPPGVGARNLEECLILQLAQTRYFNTLNLQLIHKGLDLLSEKNYSKLSKLLKVPNNTLMEAVEIIKTLNPIPSRGFYAREQTNYIFPEATFRIEGHRIIVEMNRAQRLRFSLNKEYSSMLGREEYEDIQSYLREQITQAKNLKLAIDGREETLETLFQFIANHQSDYFLYHSALKPMTMRQIAEYMGVNISTVSRAVKNKYIEFEGKLILLRDLFSTALGTENNEFVTAAAVQHQLKVFVKEENPKEPLTDEALRILLSQAGVEISRRTISKYRKDAGIPAANARRLRC